MQIFLKIILASFVLANIQAQCHDRYQYLDANGLLCLPCPYSCRKCSSESHCIECIDQFFLNSNNQCEKCVFGCSVCTDGQSCSTCNQGLYLTNEGGCLPCQLGVQTCTIAVVQTCQPTYFLLSTICAGCFANCKTCIDFMTCTKCSEHFYLSSNSLSCQPCAANCLICHNNTNCISCQSAYHQSNGQCLSSNCSHTPFCKSCTSSICLTCHQGMYLNSSGKCQQGSSLLCLSANGPYQTNCLTSELGCPSYSTAQQDINGNVMGVCLPKRATKQKQYIFIKNTVSSCNSSCQTASSSSIKYDTSQAYYKINYYLNVKFYSSTSSRNFNIHITSITDATSLTSQTQTIDLSSDLNAYNQYDPTCSNCRLTHKIVSGQFTISGGLNQTMFEFNDSNGLFHIYQAVFQHFVCKVNFCSICLSQMECSSCFQPYYLQITSCVAQCDAGFYKYQKACYLQCPKTTYTVESTYSCSPCILPCITCIDFQKCSSCAPGTFLQGQQCLNSCSNALLFANTTSMSCQPCPNPCLACALQNTTIKCLSCVQGYLLTNGSCLFSCPWGQFGIQSNSLSQCSLCSQNCTQCQLQNSFCGSCASGFLLYEHHCNQTNLCLSGYFANSSFNKCQSCSYPCSTCQFNSTHCRSCLKGSLMNGECLNTCPDTFYSDYSTPTNITCKQCQSPCRSCDSQSQCTACANQTYLHQKSCLSECPTNYFKKQQNLTCMACVPPCKSCLNQSYCYSCSTGYLDNSVCTLQCNTSSYIANDFSCKLCVAPCLQCYSQSSCNYCALPHLLFNTWCLTLTECQTKPGYYPQYYYNQTVQTKGECKACTFPCSTCANNSVSCMSCSIGYLFVPNLLKCVLTCPNSYYKNSSHCLICDNNCFSCDTTATNCLSCSSGFYLENLTKTCVSACPQSFYGQDSSKTCEACLSPCRTCYNAFLCKSCISNIFYLKQCVQQCPVSTFHNTTQNSCVSCTNNCLTCNSSTSNCLSCINGFFLYNYTCLLDCPPLFYKNQIVKVCQACSSPCLECLQLANCVTCIDGFYLLDGQCKSSCPSAYFANNSSKACEQCNNTICLTCVNSVNNCLTCKVDSGYYLSNAVCVTQCPNSTYKSQITGICETCNFPCLQCSNDSICLTCETNYYLFQNRCFSKCPIAYFPNNASACQSCSLNCQICTKIDICLQCVDRFYVWNNNCVAQCPLGSYTAYQQMTNYQVCANCSGDCINCSSLQFCFQCVPGLIGFNGLCLRECPLLHYSQSATNQCSKCSEFCTHCLNSTYCLKCIGSYLYNHTCLQVCPNTTYPYQGTTCEQCVAPCRQCSGEYMCKTCLEGYIYFHQYCVLRCPSDVWYYPHNNSCNAQCPYNKYLERMECYLDRCGLYLVALNGYCIKQCSYDYYISRRQQCNLCSINPTYCTHPFKADLKVVYVEALTLVIYFNQKAEIAPFSNISVEFKDISGKTFRKNASSYEITEYKLQIKYNYDQISLNNVTVTLPYLKSQQTEQSLSKNTLEVQIDQYYNYEPYKTMQFIQYIPLLLLALLFVATLFNILNKTTHFSQLLDYAQIVAVTLYLDIQYPPVLQTFLANFKISLGILAKNLVNTVPYNFSPPKFIFYNIDTSIIRSQMLLLVIFLLLLIFFVTVILLNTYKPPLFNGLVKTVRYRRINDLFSICITPLYLFSFQISALKPFQIFITILLAFLGIGYVAWISYKIVQVKKLAQLQGLIGTFEKTSSKLGLMYIPFAYIRRFVLTFGLGVAPLYPISTLTLLMVLTFLIMICIYFYEPFDDKYTDYVTIFMECSLTFYILCLIVMALQTIPSFANHNFGLFLIATITLTFAICLGWLIYLTINDIRTKGWCPKAVEDEINLQNLKDDYSETVSQKNRNREAKQRQEEERGKNSKDANKKVSIQNDQISANQLLNKYKNELDIERESEKDQFKHWNQQSSQNSQNSKKGNQLPDLMIKNQRKPSAAEPLQAKRNQD